MAALFLWRLLAEGVPLEAMSARAGCVKTRRVKPCGGGLVYMEATSGKVSAGSNKIGGWLFARRWRAWPAMVLNGRVILRLVLSKNDGAVPHSV